MRKFIIIICLLSSMQLNAQDKPQSDKYAVITNRFWNNWFVGVNGGAQIYLGEFDKLMKYNDRISPALDISVGKWFTPSIGTRIMYSGFYTKGATKNKTFATKMFVDESQLLYKQKIEMMNLHADVMFNTSNLLFGYNPKRFYNMIPYAGIGCFIAWEKERNINYGIIGGILNTFRICPGLDLNLDIRGAIVDENFDNETGGFPKDGLASVSLGITCYIKKINWKRPSNGVVNNIDFDREELLNKLKTLNEENNSLISKLDSTLKNNKTQIIKSSQTLAAPFLLLFNLGSSKILPDAEVNLSFLAEVIKKDPSVHYTIIGYADKSTGSYEVNQRISRQRAQNAYNCLVDLFNVPKEQLNIDYKGGVENLFYNNPQLNRAVIIKNSTINTNL